VPEGQAGELHSSNSYTFDGYWGLPEKTREAFRGHYCTVGDLARRDEDGFLYLFDRKSNMIISGGENVYPSEVESLLGSHPKVKDVAVIGGTDAKWGERVHAVVCCSHPCRRRGAYTRGNTRLVQGPPGRPQAPAVGLLHPGGGDASDGDRKGPASRAAGSAHGCGWAAKSLRRRAHMHEGAAAVQDLNADVRACAAWIARFLKARGIDCIFGLQGGHIQPIWDHVDRLGIHIVDVRDEGAAVQMAHAHAELTGQLGVAMVTAGPGVTNTVTAIANASLARAPVLLIGGCTSRPQANMGPLKDIPHVDILRPVTRYARTARVADQVIRELDEAVSCATGYGSDTGPVYIEIPTDVLRTPVEPQLVLDEWMRGSPARIIPPDPAAVVEAVEVLWFAKRPLVITGRGARQAGPALRRLLGVF
jgi:hypothetical protein